jgi:hypothetical protein
MNMGIKAVQMGWKTFLILICSWTVAVPAAEIPINHPEVLAARKVRDLGRFEAATRMLQQLRDSSTTLSSDLRRAIDLEIEKIRRTRQDYPLTRSTLLEAFQRRFRNFTEQELDEAIAADHLDSLEIDGTTRFVGSSVSNLLWRRGEALRSRLIKPAGPSHHAHLYKIMQEIGDTTNSSAGPYVLPQDWQATITLTVAPNTVPAGHLVRAWLPYPQELPHQTSVTLIETVPAGGWIAPAETTQRSVYLERMALAQTTTTFQATYRFRTFARLFRPQDHVVRPFPSSPSSPWRQYLESRPPHLDLADGVIRSTAREIVGDTTHPLAKVRLIHQWMIRNLIYQYAREYSTLDNIARTTLDHRAGDCGQHGMLFLALCRVSGVPARWTSGWEMTDPEGEAYLHDWTEVWIEPYGWIPVDTDMALVAVRHPDGGITPKQAQELADFYVGNMDGHRLTVNQDYGRPLVPAKKDFRSETVDFQRGELESDGKNLYFDQWDYSMEIRPIR